MITNGPDPASNKRVLSEDTLERNRRNFYITVPWSGQYYVTVRGAENFHIYLWVAKDLCWVQDYVWPGICFGGLAVAWMGILAYHAIESHNYEEVYMLLCTALWLIGNFVWMEGELVNEDDYIAAPACGHIFEAAFALLMVYYVFLRPLGWVEPSAEQLQRYESIGLKSRFKFFKSWRQYEHMHTLCWLGKDWSWNQLNPYTWVIFLIPTVLIAIDFIYTTWNTHVMAIDTVHYIAQLMWVLANAVWALSEIFLIAESDDPIYLFNFSSAAVHEARWYSSWLLLLSYFPIIILYLIWLPLTLVGRIKAAEIPENGFIDEQRSQRSNHSQLKGLAGQLEA